MTARRVGFTLGEIKDMLALRQRGLPPCAYVAVATERRIREIDRQQAHLRALKWELIQLRKRASDVPAPALEEGVCCNLLQG